MKINSLFCNVKTFHIDFIFFGMTVNSSFNTERDRNRERRESKEKDAETKQSVEMEQ